MREPRNSSKLSRSLLRCFAALCLLATALVPLLGPTEVEGA